MNDFVDIWRVFNLVVFEFYEFFTNFLAKHWNSNLKKQFNITFVEIYVKISIKLEKKFQFGRVLFSRRDLFLAKSDLASTILLLPWIYYYYVNQFLRLYRWNHLRHKWHLTVMTSSKSANLLNNKKRIDINP